MSLPPPSPSDRYQLTTSLYKWTIALWNSVFGSIADRLNALEEREADYQEVIDAGTGAAIEYIQNAVAPQLEQIGDTVDTLNTNLAEAQDILDALQTAGIPAENIPVAAAGSFPAGTSAQEALEQLDAAQQALGDSLVEHAGGSDVHAAARATQAEARAGLSATKTMSPLRVREARLMRTNLQSSAYTVVAADFGQMLAISGTVTVALTAAATLGDGFYCYVRNTGSGVVTIDPAGAETIDGAATLAVSPGAEVRVHCNGTLFRTSGKFGFEKIGSLVTVPGGTSAIDITTASLFDKTYEEIVVEFDRLMGSNASQNLYLSRRNAGIWGNFSYGRGLTATGSGMNHLSPGNIGAIHNADLGATGEIRVTGMAASRYPQVKFRTVGAYAASTYWYSTGLYVDPPGLDGLRLSLGAGTFTSGYYQLYGKRAS